MRSMTMERLVEWVIRDELPKSRKTVLTGERPKVASGNAFELLASIDWGGARPSIVNEFGVIALDCAATVDDDALTVFRVAQAIEDDGAVDAPIEADVFDGLTVAPHADVDKPAEEARRLFETALCDAFDQTVTEIAVDGICGSDGTPPMVTVPRRGWWALAIDRAFASDDGLMPRRFRLDYERGRSGSVRWFRHERKIVDGRLQMREVAGLDPKGRRPYGDAFRKARLDPDPVPVFVERIEWIMHRAWLAELRRRLPPLAGIAIVDDAGVPPWIRRRRVLDVVEPLGVEPSAKRRPVKRRQSTAAK